MWWTDKTHLEEFEASLRVMTEAIASRVADPRTVQRAVSEYNDTTTLGAKMAWTPGSLGFGNTSLSLSLFESARALGHEELLRHAHTMLQNDVRSFDGARPDIGLFGGMAGVLVAAHSLADGQHYAGLLTDLENFICGRASDACEFLVKKPEPIAPLEFDMMGGIAGTAIALTLRAQNSVSRSALRTIVNALETLCSAEPYFMRFATLPRDWPDQGLAARFPEGYLNLGVAHGLPGVLGAISLAARHGVATETTNQTIGTIAEFLFSVALHDEYGINWPAAIGTGTTTERKEEQKPTRAAWCYGSPGVCCALYQAGRAIGDKNLSDRAKEGLEAVFRRPRERLSLYSPTLCHGKAGLALMAAGIAAETGSEFLEEQVFVLINEILESRDDETILGVQDQESPGVWIDNPGFLEGAVGVLATLACILSERQPPWLRILLQAPPQ